MESAGTTLDGFATKARDSVTGYNGVVPALTSAKTAFDSFMSSLTQKINGKTIFDNLLDGVKTWWKEFGPYLAEAKEKINELISV